MIIFPLFPILNYLLTNPKQQFILWLKRIPHPLGYIRNLLDNNNKVHAFQGQNKILLIDFIPLFWLIFFKRQTIKPA